VTTSQNSRPDLHGSSSGEEDPAGPENEAGPKEDPSSPENEAVQRETSPSDTNEDAVFLSSADATRQQKRRILLGTVASILLCGGIVAATIALSSHVKKEDTRPTNIVMVHPTPGSPLVLSAERVGVRVRQTWYCELVIDGKKIPEEQLSGSKELGECFFRPDKGQTIEKWSPGIHTVEVKFFSLAYPDINDTYTFSFRA